MDFISVSPNNNSNTVFCSNCGGKMLFVTTGKLAENYICESCGVTIDPKLEYISQETEVCDMAQDENDSDMLFIVQKQDPPSKKQGPTDWIDEEMKQEIERGGRKQVVSISTNSNEAFVMKGSGINRIERPPSSLPKKN